MFRHNHNSKLYKYTTEEKRHYKLYKKKKVWVVAGVLLFGPVAFVPTYVNADEINPVEVMTENELEQVPPSNESASTEINEGVDAQATSETNVAKAPVDTTSTGATTPSTTFQTSETSLAEQTSETLQAATPALAAVSDATPSTATANNTLATAATTDEQDYTGEDVIKLQNVTNGSTLGSITTSQADDGSTIYTYHATSTGTSQTRVGMTVTYTGNKGDTFSMVVTPSKAQLTGFNSYTPTGSPKIEKLANGVIKYTWTITGSAETSTVKQEIPAVASLFYESSASANDPYPPYQGSAGGDASILATGDYYQIDFLINGLKAPADSSAKIVLAKELTVLGSSVTDLIDSGNKINGVAQVNPNTNYLYKTTLNKEAGKYSLRLKNYYLEVPVPEHFVLDEDETVKMNRSWVIGSYIMYGAVSITQPNGEGTPIIVENIHSLAGGSTNQPEIYFVGHYTSTDTSGVSDMPSGWYDLGDGDRQYFGKINVDTREELATPSTGTGFKQNVLAPDSAQTTEYYSIYLRVTNDQQTGSRLAYYAPGYKNNYTDRTSAQLVGKTTIKTPISETGDPSAPVLFAVGLNATGSKGFTPTYHIELPAQITSTGITMPLNNVEGDFADYREYNPAQTGYTVVVTGDDGSTVTQHLQAGENYNPLTGLIDHFGTFSTGAKLAEGVKIATYDVTPDNEYFANAIQTSANLSGINDIATGMISVLGYLNSTAKEDESYLVKIKVDSENRTVPFELTVVPIASQKLEVQGYNYPGSNVGTGTNQTVYQAGNTFTIGVQVLGKRYTAQSGTNLDAGGILTGKANQTSTDLPGHGLNVPYLTVKDPILYFTLPDQTQVTNFKNSNTFYQITKPPATGVPTPKITQTTNTDGQTVMILDWTGTGFELLPEMLITLNLKVDENAVNGFDTARTADTLYEYTAPGKTKDLYTAAQLAKLGVSTDGLRAYKPNVNSESNTTWIQVGGDFSNTTLPDSYKTQIKFADGTSANTMILDAANNNTYLRIVAPAVVSPGILIQGTKDYGLSSAGTNYPAQDQIELNGQKQGLQKFQFGIINNTDETITNAISVLNLPQSDTPDSNNLTAKHEFTLNISGAGELNSSPVNNVPQDEHTLYYVTQMATLSTDGQTVTFADGTTWTKGEPVLASMLTASQVTDWSQIKSLILFIPSMTKESELLYDFNAYSPTSSDNAGKQAVLTQVAGYDGQISLLKNSVTDTYAVYASMTFVDQVGNQINGHPTVTGQAILDPQTGKYEVTYPELIGAPGETLKLGTPDSITGYKYTQTLNSSPTFKADGSTLVTRVYQVDQAKLLVGNLQGTLLATATGDPHANTGNNYSNTPTGVTNIVFGITDEQLARAGYTYTVTVVDSTGKQLSDSNGQSKYATLAQALVAQGIFDATSDKNGATQNFIVNYEGVFQQAVIISENDPLSVIPKTITVAQTKAPFYHNGKTGELMFYDETDIPLISDDMITDGIPIFKRENYRYTVLAPNGSSYNSVAEALAARLTFDATDNTGQTDSEIQVYQIIYEEDLQTLRVTIIDDQGTKKATGTYEPATLVAAQELGTGLSNTPVTTETKQTLADLVKKYTDQGYILVSQSLTPDNYDNDPKVDQEVVVHLAHGTFDQAGETRDVTQTINYIYISGPKQGEQVVPPNVQTLTFTSTQTIDQVTGEILNTVWSPPQNTTSVTSPVIAGYDNDQAVVAEATFTSESPDKVLTVYYNALEQGLTYSVIDDTTQTILAEDVELATGLSGMPLDPSVATDYQALITSYLAQGYDLVSADQLPQTYDNDVAVAQNVTVHLKHGQTTQAGADKVVTQTITYLYGNGPKAGQTAGDTYTKSYTFTSVETLDTVTNEVIQTTWSAPKVTETVISPTISGYSPNQAEVSSQVLTHESEDLNTTVLYTAGTQVVKVHYIDMYGVAPGEKGIELTTQTQTLTGDAGASYSNVLWDHVASGYELISADPGASSGTFDEDPDATQDYYVYLTHALKQVEETPVTVSQTINYVYSNGPKAGQIASEPVKESRTFVPTYTVDQVTGQNVGEPTWTPATTEFNAVVSPTISGYVPDKAAIQAVTVTPLSPDSVITVNYSAQEQLLTYTVIDETTQTTLVANAKLATGLTDTPLAINVANDYQALIASYQAQGYVLVSADQLPQTYDNDVAVAQNVTIYLKHGQTTQAGADKVVTQTITYLYGNGPKAGQTAGDTYTKSYTFTSVETLDTVTNEVIQTTWSAPKVTETVISPTISGYSPNQAEVSSQVLTHESEDLTATVLYTAGTQVVKVHYIDMYGVAPGEKGIELTTQTQTLTGDAGASYSNVLWDHVASGYELISADPGASSGTFDEDPDATQDYYVYLTHALKQVEETPVTVSQTINYVYSNGPKAGQIASEPVKESQTFVPTYTVDQVTGQNVGEPTWTPATTEFNAVVSPTISGYVPDKAAIQAVTVTPLSPDSVITVNYSAQEQLLTYTVIDETTQTTLVANAKLATGLTDTPLAINVANDYQALIASYQAQGYVLVSADQLPQTYDNDVAVAQNVTIYLKHGQTTQAGADKVVTQTITYLYGNGPKAGQTAGDTYTKSYTFTSVETLDTVTNEVIQTTWSAPKVTETVISPTISGYSPNQAEVSSQVLTHESEDLTATVLYTAGTQVVKVHYIDMYGVAPGEKGIELTTQTQTLTGDAGASYSNVLWDHVASGYELISADPGASSGTFDEDPDTTQDYYVYLTHALKQVEETPVTVKQTINYVYGNGPKAGQIASEPVKESRTFVPTYTVDQVTGQNVGEPTWTPASEKFGTVVTPTIAGYTPDLPQVLEKLVTPMTADDEITVTYEPNEQRLTYTVIDDTSMKPLVENVELAVGQTDSALETSTADNYRALIASYVAQGYVLVSADPLPTNFDHNDALDQNVTLHLAHGQMTQAGATKVVDQTITYLYGNGPKKGQSAADAYTKSYTFTSVETIDTVTGEVLNTVWSKAQTTETVVSPTVSGYLPSLSEIASQTLTHESNDQTATVLYTAGDQLVTIHYLDMYGVASGEKGNELTAQKQTLTGDAGASYSNILWDYTAYGYELVQADLGATSGSFDEDPAITQDYYVYLTHTLSQVVGTPITVGQTINYLYQTGPLAGQMASDTVRNSQTFVPLYTVDQVTEQNVGGPTWKPAMAEFSTVISPTIKGYTPDKPVIASVVVGPTSQDMVENVYYRADVQKITVTVSDETTGAIISSGEVITKGSSASQLPLEANQTYAQIIRNYQKQGYEVVSADPLPSNFDDDSNVDQVVRLKLVHGKQIVAGASKKVTQTITYLYGNGPNSGKTAMPPSERTYTFNATAVVDAVTGAVLETTWGAPQVTETIVSPPIDGYVASQAEVASQTLTPESPDQTVTILYTVGPQTVQIHYIDMYNTTEDGRELSAQQQTLTGAAGASYHNILWDYAANGYELLTAQPQATTGEFDTDPTTKQDYYVYLTHAVKQVTQTPVTVTQTITYIYGSGPNKGRPVADSKVTAVVFVPTYTIDQVTQQPVGEISWEPDSYTLAEVVSPNIAGYSPDQTVIIAETVTPTSENIEHTVYYTADTQKVILQVIDEETGTVLEPGQVLVQGESGNKLPPDADLTYEQLILEYQKQGYQVVSADQLPSNFDHDSAVDQVVTLKLIHAKKVQAGADKSVTQVVKYLYGNGPLQGQVAAKSVVAKYNFTSTVVVDAVTGEVLTTTWSDPQMSLMVKSPQLKGYLPDLAQVEAVLITAGMDDLVQVVNYYLGEQTVKIHYIDVNDVIAGPAGYAPSDGQEVPALLQVLVGQSGADYQNSLRDLASFGYKLVTAQPEATKGSFDSDPTITQNYYVYLVHDIMINTGEPVIITDTVNYVYGNGPHAGQQVISPNVVTKTFIPTYTFDKVTGELISVIWSGDGTIAARLVPQIAGYIPDRWVILSTILTPEMTDRIQTVYYLLDEAVISGEIPANDLIGKEPKASAQLPPAAPKKHLSAVTLPQQELPQTGDKKANAAIFIGLGLLSSATLLGTFGINKHKKKVE